MKGIGKKGKEMDLANFILIINYRMKDSGQIIKKKDKVLCIGKMELCTKENLIII